MKMATPRRTSQQQQQQQQPNSLLSSPPRGSSLPGTPPGSPPAPADDVTPLPHRGAMENAADGEVAPASPTTTSPALALTASSSSSSGSSSSTSSSASSPTTTEGSGTSPGSTPDSGSGNPGSGGSSSSGGGGGANGAFRELFEACRNGDVSRVKKLVDAVNVNAKDMAGRKSTPLHFAAGKPRKSRFKQTKVTAESGWGEPEELTDISYKHNC